MTTTTSTTVQIEAPAARVWQLVTDPQWWNRAENGVVEVTGHIEQGEKIRLVSELQPKRGFTLSVAEMEEPRRIRCSAQDRQRSLTRTRSDADHKPLFPAAVE